jgi:uncharacterized membrane protein SirB2
MTAYWLLKSLHVGAVIASGSLFLLRGGWMLTGSANLQKRWVKVVPHAVDSVLLAAAVGLMLVTGQYPFVHGWLTAKVLALVGYIVLGSVALKRGRTQRARTVALVAAIATFAYMAGVALTRSATLLM